MFNIKCACGKANKNFKNNIGSFYIGECCAAEGFDDLGNRKVPGLASTQPSISAQQTELSPISSQMRGVEFGALPPTDLTSKPSMTDRVLSFLGRDAKKLTKSKLGDLRVEEIKKIAADRGIEGSENMTRAQLTELLLPKS